MLLAGVDRADESSRVFLQPIRGLDGSDYINASFVDVSYYALSPQARPTVGGIKRCCDTSVCPSVCLSDPFSESSLSLDSYMRVSPFQMHSKGGSTVGYASIQMLSVGA